MPSSIGVNFTIDPGAKRRKREQEWDQATRENPDLAPDFASYNRGKAEYVRTGQFPTSRPQEVRTNLGVAEDVPNPEGGVPISVLPETEVSVQDVPIRRGSPSYTFNQKTGQFTQDDERVPRGAEVRQFRPPDQSYAIGYDDQGNVVTQEPIAGDRDISFRIGDLAARGGAGRGRGRGGLTPKEQAWKLAYDKAVRALMPRYDFTGEPIPVNVDPALLQAGIEAGQGLGVDTAFLEKFMEELQPAPTPPPAPPRPGLGQKVKDFFSGPPKAGAPNADTSPAEALPRGADAFSADVEKARLAVSRGLVSPEEADRRLKKKYGRGM